MKKILYIISSLVLAFSLSSCNQNANSDTTTLTLAHSLSQEHSVHIALEAFAEEVADKTNGRYQVRIFPNGQLGSENESMEQIMAGVLSMSRIASPGLATYERGYDTFGLPYIFENTEDYYNIMDSDEIRDFFLSSEEKGFVTLTYYDSGSRSFYTKDRAIKHPDDLKGLKIRVQDMRSQTEMMNYLGGTPVAMSYGDVYTSLQTGIIDGTENNETALTIGGHGEIAKVYSKDEHAMIPDALIISSQIWKNIDPADQQIILEAARNSTELHKELWAESIAEARVIAETEMGVEFVEDIDKEPFMERTKPLVDEYRAQYPEVDELLNTIESVRSK